MPICCNFLATFSILQPFLSLKIQNGGNHANLLENGRLLDKKVKISDFLCYFLPFFPRFWFFPRLFIEMPHFQKHGGKTFCKIGHYRIIKWLSDTNISWEALQQNNRLLYSNILFIMNNFPNEHQPVPLGLCVLMAFKG